MLHGSTWLNRAATLWMQARALCAAAERNSAWVGKARDKCDFAPKDAQQLAAFLAAEREARQVSYIRSSASRA